jgi:hypothetical protein
VALVVCVGLGVAGVEFGEELVDGGRLVAGPVAGVGEVEAGEVLRAGSGLLRGASTEAGVAEVDGELADERGAQERVGGVGGAVVGGAALVLVAAAGASWVRVSMGAGGRAVGVGWCSSGGSGRSRPTGRGAGSCRPRLWRVGPDGVGVLGHDDGSAAGAGPGASVSDAVLPDEQPGAAAYDDPRVVAAGAGGGPHRVCRRCGSDCVRTQ